MSSTRERILASASVAFSEHGIRKTRMHHVCDAAGCSRATMYRHFADKDDLISAYAAWQLERQLGLLRDHLSNIPDIAERLVESVVFAVDAIETDPGIRPFFAEDAVGIVGRILGKNPAMGVAAFEFLVWARDTSEGMDRVRPDLRWDWAAEWLVRLVLSLATVPGPNADEDQRRAVLQHLLLPSILAN